MNRFKLILAAILSLISVPSFALADSVEISAAVSTEIKIEIKSDDNSTEYSGVIVDCRGLGLQTAASPVIKDESGKIIYGDKDLDFDKINELGMAEYTTSIQDSAARAGTHPLIVKAVKLENFNCNPVISNADAERLVLADRINEFFKDLKVVFLTD